MKKKKAAFDELVHLMTRLRSPDGCPWDRVQTHESLLKYLREEAGELRRAVQKKDTDNLKEELGDVLLQVLFHSEIARERGDFDVYDVLNGLRRKLIHRHPHVFKRRRGDPLLTPEEVRRRWKGVKRMGKR